MKILVAYKSKTGFTEKYARWIAEELKADIFDYHKVKQSKLERYDIIIYGGSLHAVGIIGVKIITQNLNKLKDKKVIVFAVGASPFRQEVIKKVRDENFSKEEQEYIKFYYLRGGFNYNKLPLWDKILMKLLQMKLKRKKILTPDDKGLLNAYKKPVDFTWKGNIAEIVSYVQSLSA
jgi:menaquinone-dependent protoporphyrinogen IX oxidase